MRRHADQEKIRGQTGQTYKSPDYNQKILGIIRRGLLFKPLDMIDTAFAIPQSKVKRFAKPLPMDSESGRPRQVITALVLQAIVD